MDTRVALAPFSGAAARDRAPRGPRPRGGAARRAGVSPVGGRGNRAWERPGRRGPPAPRTSIAARPRSNRAYAGASGRRKKQPSAEDSTFLKTGENPRKIRKIYGKTPEIGPF